MNRTANVIRMGLAGLILLATTTGAESPIYVATTAADFGTGSTAYLAPGAAEAETDLLNVHSDAVARFYDGRIYVVNRLDQDNIIVLDPADLRTPVVQYSVGNGTNPQDVEFVSPNKAYVSLNNEAYLLVGDPQVGTEFGQIDLSAFADADGLPETGQMALVGDRLFVAVQRLDRDNYWGPSGESYLVVIDTQTDTVIDADPDAAGVQGILLAGTNPVEVMAIGGQLVVALVGSFLELDGGVEVIDPETYESRGLVITEEALGGQTGTIAMVSPSRGYVTASTWPTYDLYPFDLSSGEVGEKLTGYSGGYLPDLAVDGDRLIVADRGSEDNLNAAGLLIYDANTGELTAGPISTGLPPNAITVMSDPVEDTAVVSHGSAQPGDTRLGDAYPNPFNAGTQIPFMVETASARTELRVCDLLGRSVRTLVAGHLPAGHYAVDWNGLDDSGRAVGSGAYVVEFRSADSRTTGKVMLLK